MKIKTLFLPFLLQWTLSSALVVVRKSTASLSEKEWTRFSDAVAAMKARDAMDPMSWTYQANIHGWQQYDGSLAADRMADRLLWHRCQHGHFFFLVWHRMFLYFFERILRHHSRDPHFALPYWDYAHSPQVPAHFRQPNDTHVNALFDPHRCPGVNAGRPLPPELVSPLSALRSTFFAANKHKDELNVCHAFGGGRVSGPAFQGDAEGLLELIPHNNVHVFVGGPDGHLSDNCRSAQDPLFLAHHAMVDRIWQSWSRAGGPQPSDALYLNATFEFFDERGARVVARVVDFLNIERLDYRYDRDIDVHIDIDSDAHHSSRPQLYVSVDHTHNLTVSAQRLSLPLHFKPQFHSRLLQAVSSGGGVGGGQASSLSRMRSTLQLSVDYLVSDVIFHAYLSAAHSPHPPLFVGAVTFIEAKCVPKNRRQTSLSITNCFDVSEPLQHVLKGALLSGQWSRSTPPTLNLTFVPKSCDSVLTPTHSQPILALNRILLIHFFY